MCHTEQEHLQLTPVSFLLGLGTNRGLMTLLVQIRSLSDPRWGMLAVSTPFSAWSLLHHAGTYINSLWDSREVFTNNWSCILELHASVEPYPYQERNENQCPDFHLQLSSIPEIMCTHTHNFRGFTEPLSPPQTYCMNSKLRVSDLDDLYAVFDL